MTITLELTQEQENRLIARTRAAGLNNPADYLFTLINNPSIAEGSGKDLLAELDSAGVLGSYGRESVDSLDVAKQIRIEAEKRN